MPQEITLDYDLLSNIIMSIVNMGILVVFIKWLLPDLLKIVREEIKA